MIMLIPVHMQHIMPFATSAIALLSQKENIDQKSVANIETLCWKYQNSPSNESNTLPDHYLMLLDSASKQEFVELYEIEFHLEISYHQHHQHQPNFIGAFWFR